MIVWNSKEEGYVNHWDLLGEKAQQILIKNLERVNSGEAYGKSLEGNCDRGYMGSRCLDH